MSQPSYDLNADVGEGFGYDEALLAVVTSANVACGFHAGDAATMRATCDLAAARMVSVGAQVSYRDREGFGRRRRDVEPTVLRDDVVEQVAALAQAAEAAGVTVSYLKPHGALYHRVVADEEQAAAVVGAAASWRLPVLGLPGSRLLELAADAGLDARREFFADRAYDAEGGLVSRSEPGALVTDLTQVVGRVRQLVEEATVTAVDGSTVSVAADSICVHGDTPDAARLARAVADTVTAAGGVVASRS